MQACSQLSGRTEQAYNFEGKQDDIFKTYRNQNLDPYPR